MDTNSPTNLVPYRAFPTYQFSRRNDLLSWKKPLVSPFPVFQVDTLSILYRPYLILYIYFSFMLVFALLMVWLMRWELDSSDIETRAVTPSLFLSASQFIGSSDYYVPLFQASLHETHVLYRGCFLYLRLFPYPCYYYLSRIFSLSHLSLSVRLFLALWLKITYTVLHFQAGWVVLLWMGNRGKWIRTYMDIGRPRNLLNILRGYFPLFFSPFWPLVWLYLTLYDLYLTA